jgi:hypothetical protein
MISQNQLIKKIMVSNKCDEIKSLKCSIKIGLEMVYILPDENAGFSVNIWPWGIVIC